MECEVCGAVPAKKLLRLGSEEWTVCKGCADALRLEWEPPLDKQLIAAIMRARSPAHFLLSPWCLKKLSAIAEQKRRGLPFLEPADKWGWDRGDLIVTQFFGIPVREDHTLAPEEWRLVTED